MTPTLRNGKWYCPMCGDEIDIDFIPPRYCDQCGVKLEWE